MDRRCGAMLVVVVAAVFSAGQATAGEQETEQRADDKGVQAADLKEEQAAETDEAEGAGEGDGGGLRSVYVGVGTGYLLGVDSHIGPRQRLGVDMFVWRDPLFQDCDPTCFRRTEFRVHWTRAWGNSNVNGGVMAGVSGGRLRDRQSDRHTREGIFIGPMVGLRGSYTPSPGWGIGAQAALTPSYFSGTEQVGAPRPSSTNGIRMAASAALFLEFGDPQMR